MPPFVKVRSFLRNLFLSRRVEADLDKEVRSHLELMTEENIRAGMGPEDARRAARVGFRSVDTYSSSRCFAGDRPVGLLLTGATRYSRGSHDRAALRIRFHTRHFLVSRRTCG